MPPKLSCRSGRSRNVLRKDIDTRPQLNEDMQHCLICDYLWSNHLSIRLIFFNHKGGVSKTTSAFNIGWMLSKSKRVLLVDGDPQCNLTSLILRDGFERYYFDEATKGNNIKDGVSPAFKGTPTPISSFHCPSPPRAPNLFLLPGHGDLSEYDASLTLAQTSSASLAALQNLPGAFSELIKIIEQDLEIDYTIIDLNPGLSAINQNLFLLSDYFIVPTNPDPFSLMAIDTLRKILPRWGSWKSNNEALFEDSAYRLPSGMPKFVGTIIQRFNVRNGTAAKPYRDNIGEIQEQTVERLLPALERQGMALSRSAYERVLADPGGLCLGQIPDFQGLLPKANTAGVPVFDIEDEEIKETGPVLAGMVANRDKFRRQFEVLRDRVLELMGSANAS